MTEPSARQVVDSVTAGAHWKVTIRPTVFVSTRILSLGQCWQLVDAESVLFRGWDYPHVDHENRAQGNDWIQSWVVFIGEREYWRLYQSGLFVHIFAFREDAFDSETRARTLDRVEVPLGFEPAGMVDFIGALYTLTEVFEFASRLAQREVLGDTASVTVEMRNVSRRLLVSHDWNRMWRYFRPASDENLSFELTDSTTALTANARDSAVDAAVHFFERFGVFDIPRSLLADEQTTFVERRRPRPTG